MRYIYMNILKEDKNYIYYENDIFSKQRQRLLKKRFHKREQCFEIIITLIPYNYTYILLKDNYHLNL